MMKTTKNLYQREIHALFPSISTDTLYDRRRDPLETELLKNRLYRNEDLLRYSSLHHVSLSNRFESMERESKAIPVIDRMIMPKDLEIPLNPSDYCNTGIENEKQKRKSIFSSHIAITFEGKCFQFSGTLEFGRREDALFLVEKLG